MPTQHELLLLQRLLLFLMLALVLQPPRCLRRLLLLLEPIVSQPQRTEVPTLPCSCPWLLCLLMHVAATHRSLLRLPRLSRLMLQLNLSTLHRVPQCLLPLHPLMLRNNASVRGSELPDRKKSPRYPHYMKCCCCG